MTSKHTANRHGSAVITLPSDTEMVITRAFDAPAELIFTAWTTPDLVQRWWGYEGDDWLVCEIDLRVGGTWRWVTRHGDFEVAFHGEYREIARPHRLVSTEVFEGAPDASDRDAGTLNTLTLDETAGVTTLTTLVQCKNREQRDAIIASGMEGGMQVSMNRLEDLVRGMA